MSASLRVHAFQLRSRANGPGWRAVLWLQGCTLGCPGCFNPATFDVEGGQQVSVEGLVAGILEVGNELEGITLSGGEPLLQAPAVTLFLRLLRGQSNLSAILLTGLTWGEIMTGNRKQSEWLRYVDVVIAGRYIAPKRIATSLCGSANKSIHLLTNRYTASDLFATPESELWIESDGQIQITGVAPLQWDSGPWQPVPKRDGDSALAVRPSSCS